MLVSVLATHERQSQTPENDTNGGCLALNLTSLLTGVKDIQDKRKKHFHQMCETLNVGSTNITRLLYLPKYNLATKFVPKIGSTFMTAAFDLLAKNESDSNNEFSRSRMVVHQKHFNRFRRTFTRESVSNVTTMVFARNPFTRLFSAYIDKIFILNCYTLATKVISYNNEHGHKFNGDCGLDVSFEDFVRYALYSSKKYRYEHYKPSTAMLDLPVMCHAKQLIVVKQESFGSDIEYSLVVNNVENVKTQTLHEMLRCKKSRSNIVSITKTAFTKYRNLIKRVKCLSWKPLVTRLWNSFQIQGYIHENSTFPDYKFGGHKGYSNTNVFLDIALKEISDNPLSKEQSLIQRDKAALKAYNKIDQRLKTEIVNMYRFDFAFFEYNTTFQ